MEGNEPLRTGETVHEDENGNVEVHGEGMMGAWFPEGVRMRAVEVGFPSPFSPLTSSRPLIPLVFVHDHADDPL